MVNSSNYYLNLEVEKWESNQKNLFFSTLRNFPVPQLTDYLRPMHFLESVAEFREILTLMENGKIIPVNASNIFIGPISTLVLDSFSFRYKSEEFIALSDFNSFYFLFGKLFSCKDTALNFGDPTRESISFSSIQDELVSFVKGSMKFDTLNIDKNGKKKENATEIEDISLATYKTAYPVDKKRNYALGICSWVVQAYTIFHEIAHLSNGHHLMIEDENLIGAHGVSSLSDVLELDADISAARWLVVAMRIRGLLSNEELDEDYPLTEGEVAYLTCFSMLCFFMTIEIESNLNGFKNYLNCSNRYRFVFGLLLDLLKVCGLLKEDVWLTASKKAADDVLQILSKSDLEISTEETDIHNIAETRKQLSSHLEHYKIKRASLLKARNRQ